MSILAHTLAVNSLVASRNIASLKVQIAKKRTDNAKRILIFGDSNVWGDIPLQVGTRLPDNVRWTGVLQNMLGNDYEVIEEGLIGRTTNVDDPFPGFEDKNGKDYLFPCLRSQIPLDYVILLLGSNDFKKVFNRTAKDVAKGYECGLNIANYNLSWEKN